MVHLFKRFFDMVFSLLGLILLSPLFLFVVIRILIESPGPIFYKGVRAGKSKKPFKMMKFRSMVVNADKIGGPSTSGEDPRLTKVGKWIRKYKLDELPQLINVLKGEMSFVGPRPEVLSEVELYDPQWDVIFTVRPGITDFSSIKFSNEGEIIANSGIEDPHEAYRQLIQPEKLRLQKEYVENISIVTDFRILFQTFLAIVK